MTGLARARQRLTWGTFSSWLTSDSHATIGFSLLRIIFAVAMLSVLLPSFADRQYLWGAGSWWIAPHADLGGWWAPFRTLFSQESAGLFDLSYAALLLLVALFLVGWKTRWVAPILLLFWVALSSNSPILPNGGDALMRITLLFALFADLSRHFSVDAWSARRREAAGRPPRAWLPDWLRNAMHNTALILCCYQILLVYAVSSLYKLQGEEWLDGSALYYALSLTELQVLPGLSEAMWQVTPFVMLATWFAFGAQLFFPVMLLWRPTRIIAIVAITLTHLGIAVLLGLWAFSLTMIALDLLLVRDRSWLQLAARVHSRLRVLRRLITLAQSDEATTRRHEEGVREAA